MHIGEDADPEEVCDLQNRLESLFFNVVPVKVIFEPHQPQIAVYHKGDYIIGERITDFLEYATEIKTAA